MSAARIPGSGCPAGLITKLGSDAFGDKIIDYLALNGIDVSMIRQTAAANTCLAFVSSASEGARDFSFYRTPSADMLLEPTEIKRDYFTGARFLHFCSVSLGDYPMKEAHKKAIAYALEAGLTVSFDPNIRLPLWKDPALLRKTIWEFLPYAHILKMSDDELEFMTGCTDIAAALDSLFCGNVELVLFTKGKRGAEAYTRRAAAECRGVSVPVKDTTGAGDAFIGAFLFQLARHNIQQSALRTLEQERLFELLRFCNIYSAYSTLKKGAIGSYATYRGIKRYISRLSLTNASI